MSIAFHCVECGTSFDVDDSLAEKTIRCRECHAQGSVSAPAKPAGVDTQDASQQTIRPPWQLTLQLFSDIGSLVVWSALIVWSLLWLCLLISGLSKANSAIQEASASAMSAAFVVIGYAIARAAETLLSRIAAWSRR